MKPLAGRHAVVTGGGSGIGRAVALRLAAGGAAVTVMGRRREALMETVGHIAAAGGRAFFETADLEDRGETDRAVDRVLARSGAVHILVNNAGACAPTPASLPDPAAADRLIEVNLVAPMRLSRRVLPAMPADGTGRLIQIGSVLSRLPVPGHSVYSAAKAGLIGFSRSLALELAPRRITVNVLAPGWTDTDMAAEGLRGLAASLGVPATEARRRAEAGVPLGRFSAPPEIAEFCALLASDHARNLTGQVIVVDGGQLAA